MAAGAVAASCAVPGAFRPRPLRWLRWRQRPAVAGAGHHGPGGGRVSAGVFAGACGRDRLGDVDHARSLRATYGRGALSLRPCRIGAPEVVGTDVPACAQIIRSDTPETASPWPAWQRRQPNSRLRLDHAAPARPGDRPAARFASHRGVRFCRDAECLPSAPARRIGKSWCGQPCRKSRGCSYKIGDPRWCVFRHGHG
jgi:hypothetical protein